MENFNLKKFLVENNLTTNSRLLNENDQTIDDKTLIQNIDKLTEDDIFVITRNLPTEFSDGDEEEVMTGLLDIISKVNPGADIEKKKMSLQRALPETMERLKKASWSSFSVARGVKDYFEDNLDMFR